MRKNRQIMLTIALCLILLTLVYWASRDPVPPEPIPVVRIIRDVPAGSQLKAEDLELILTEDQPALRPFIHDLESAINQWSAAALPAGSLLLPEQITSAPQGIRYEDPGVGRRLMTVELRPGDLNGLYVARGNRVDLYLVPKTIRPDLEPEILENILVADIFSTTGKSIQSYLSSTQPLTSVLLCLSLDTHQASRLAEAISRSSIHVAVRNEP